MISDVCIEYNKKKKQKEHVALDIDEHDNYCEDEDDKDYDKKYLSKFDILKLNNGWNEKNETYIVRIGENAASFRHMHDKTSNQYTKYDAVLKITIAILGILLTTRSFISFESNEFTQSVSFILAIIGVMNNFLDYGKSSIEYKHSSYLFSILYHDIQHIMCMYRKDRPYAITYIQNSIKQYDHLEITGPDIPKYILKQFKSDTSNNVENEDVKSIKSVKNTDDVVEPLHNCFKINNRQNLSNIQDAFSINGDLCEKDNLSINDYNRSRGLNIQSDYETNRFYQI